MINIKLDKEQELAAKAKEGHFLCLAGAGSGKTRVIAARTCMLIEDGNPEDTILDITYTRKARLEMETRINNFLGKVSAVNVTTFHSLCFSYIAMFRPNHKEIQVMDEDDRKSIIKKLIINHSWQGKIDVSSTSMFIGHVKNKMIYTKHGITRKQRFMMMRLYFEYQEYCINHNLLDFDQMSIEFLEFLQKNPEEALAISSQYKYIMVDESQDMNRVQYEILKILSSYHNNLFLMGDMDQTVYEWRGSDPRLLNEYIEEFNPVILPLTNNYRCDGYIVDASNELISNNTLRIPKTIHAMKPKENLIEVYPFEYATTEAYFVGNKIKEYFNQGYKPSDIKVLYRENAQSTQLEAAFRVLGIKHEVNTTSLIDNKLIKTLIKYLRFIINLDDELLLEVINYPTRGIGPVKVNTIISIAAEKRISRFEAAKFVDDKHVKKFVELIEGLKESIKVLKPKEFIKYLIETLRYDKVIEKEKNEKLAQLRVEAFCEAIARYECKTSDYKQETFNLLNEMFLENEKKPDEDSTIKLMTIHQAKGLEAKIVFMVGCMNAVIPGKCNSLRELEAERRLFFVGVTRTQEKLIITYPKNYKEKVSGPSEFIKELGPCIKRNRF